MKLLSWFIVYSLLYTVTILADTPPPTEVGIKGGTDNTKIGNVGDSLKVNVTGGGGGGTVNQGTGGVSPWSVYFLTAQPVSQSGSWSVLQGGTWSVGRTWTLLNSTDSVTAFQGGSWSAAVSGTVTANIGTTGGLALDSTLSALSAKFTTTVNGLKVDGSAVTQPVSAASLPLPSNAAQESGGHLASIDSKLTAPITVTGSVTTSPNVNVHDGAGTSINSTSNALNEFITNSSLAVTGTFFQAVQPVSQSGTWTVLSQQSGTWTTGRTWNLSSGADSVAAVQSGTWTTGRTWTLSHSTDSLSDWLNDGAGNAITSQANGSQRALDVGIDVSGVQIDPRSIRALTSSDTVTVVQPTGTNLHTVVDSSALPTGAATSALQTTGNTSLSSILANQTNGTQKTQVTAIPSDLLPATQNITSQDTASTTTAQANGQNAITGTPTAGSAASFVISSTDAVEVQVTGTWTGTISSEISMDGGTTWFTRGLKQSGASYLSSTFTQNVQGGANFSGMTNYRIRATAAWTGTATVKVNSSVNPASITVTNPLTLRDSTTQSIANTIKAASTAAVAADTALVVAVSPNSPPPLMNDRTASGNITAACAYTSGSVTACAAGSTVQISSIGSGTVQFGTSGTWSATMTQDISYDPNCSSTPNSVIWYNQITLDTDVNTHAWFTTWSNTFNNDPWIIKTPGTQCTRLRAQAYTSGTVVVQMEAGQAIFPQEYSIGKGAVSTFTQSYSSSNLATGAFTTIISSTTTDINSEDIFDTSGSDYYLAWAATCGALSTSTNAIIISAGGGGKDFRIPSGNCVGFEAKTATISTGSVNMTFMQ